MGTLRGVTVMNDFVRSDREGNPGEGDRSAIWLFDAIKRQISVASGLPVHLLGARNCAELHRWVETARPADDADTFWASNYDALPLDSALAGVLLPRLDGQFVVGNEMPAYLQALLTARGVPHLDLRIHPVRFLDDLLFAARASDTGTQHTLAQLAVSQEVVFAAAGLVEAMCRYTADCALPPGTLLVMGQRTMDSSQIVSRQFFDALECQDRVARICAEYAAVLIKQHPYGGNHSLLMAAASASNVLAATSDNVYRLLAHPEITGVLTVNSSAAYEARYFGKQIHMLAPEQFSVTWRGDPVSPNAYASIDDCFLAPDFWRMILAPHTPVSPATGQRLPPKPNRLRIAHDSFWNFQEIDTDRIPVTRRGS
jgi:hypothetical protein